MRSGATRTSERVVVGRAASLRRHDPPLRPAPLARLSSSCSRLSAASAESVVSRAAEGRREFGAARISASRPASTSARESYRLSRNHSPLNAAAIR
eukprot:7073549-Prymnesium_polylepis.1